VKIKILLSVMLCALMFSFSASADQVFFYHTDPAGTPLSMTNASGAQVWKADYKPFGEENSVAGSAANNKRFVGKEKDTETGLDYFGARYMNDKLGRFISPDQVGPVDPRSNKTNEKMLSNAQRLNRYAYSLNNPYSYVDPDGNEPITMAVLANLFFGGTANAPEYRYTPTVGSQTAAQFAFEVAVMETGGRVAGELIGMLSRAPREGQKIYRVFGEKNNPFGESWTPIDPRKVTNFRSEAGLPDVNTGRFVLEGRINNTSGIKVRNAHPLDGNPGGLTEYVIPNAKSQVTIERVSGVNPGF